MTIMKTPKAIDKHPTYENFEARCPICNTWNIFNRASDLETFELIFGQAVICQSETCKQEFWIGGDLINPAWQMLLLDCELLKQHKRYSYCILNLAQAFEMYFALYLRVELLSKPYGIEKAYDLKRFNVLSHSLFDTIRRWMYFPLRNTFINLLLENIKCCTLSESEVLIKKLQSYAELEPDDDAIKNITDQKLSEILLELKKNSVSSLRNNVVHKNGYRPTLKEVETAVDQTSHILYVLDHCLGVLSEKSYIYEVI